MSTSVPNEIPVVGSLFSFASAPLPFIERAAQLGDSVRFRLGPYRAYLLRQAADVNEVLVTKADKFRKDPLSVTSGKKFLGRSLVVNDGEDHRVQRKRIQPAFYHGNLERYAKVMVEQSERMVNSWKANTPIPLDSEISAATLRIVGETLFRVDVSADIETVQNAMSEFNQIMKKEYRSPLVAMLPDWLPTEHKRRLRHSRDTLNEVINHIIAAYQTNKVQDGSDILSLILAASSETGEMSNQRLREELINLFVAGHETSSALLAWTWYFIGKHPNVEAGVKAEIATVLQGRSPTFADIPKLRYVYMTLKEALRFYPPGWMFGRQAIEDITIGQTQLKKNDFVYLSPYITQHDPRYFPEPEQFDPERFNEECEKALPKGAFFPFGGGHNVCIGQQYALMQLALMMGTVYAKYPNMRIISGDVDLDVGITIKPAQHIMAQI